MGWIGMMYSYYLSGLGFGRRKEGNQATNQRTKNPATTGERAERAKRKQMSVVMKGKAAPPGSEEKKKKKKKKEEARAKQRERRMKEGP